MGMLGEILPSNLYIKKVYVNKITLNNIAYTVIRCESLTVSLISVANALSINCFSALLGASAKLCQLFRLSVTLETTTRQALLCMGFCRQE